MSYIRSSKERDYRRELISTIKPWAKSTGPKTAEGKKISSKNSTRHGGRSQGEIKKLGEIRAYLEQIDSEL